MKFSYYADLYLKFGKNDWKSSTFNKNSGIVNNRLKCFFDYDIEKLKVSDLKLWLNAINDVSNKSKKHYINCLNSILNIALQDEIINKNPVAYLKKINT